MVKSSAGMYAADAVRLLDGSLDPSVYILVCLSHLVCMVCRAIDLMRCGGSFLETVVCMSAVAVMGSWVQGEGGEWVMAWG
jgi:hypothetical protein